MSLQKEDSSASLISESSGIEAALRRGFVRKVYGILSAQLLLTFGMVFMAVFNAETKASLCGMTSSKNCPEDMSSVTDSDLLTDPKTGFTGKDGHHYFMWDGITPHGKPAPDQCNLARGGGCFRATDTLVTYLYGSYFASIVIILAIVCTKTFSRNYPTNYIALFAFTFVEAIVVSIICLFYDATSVGIAAAMTALVTAGLTAYACMTKSDFTDMGAYLYAALLSLIVFGFVGSFFTAFYHTPWIQNLYAGAGCLIFSCYLVYDTQLILGGQHKKYQFGLDEYVFAALNIYLDIINLFLYILQLMSSRD